MARRYSPIGKEPTYDKTFDRLQWDSPILNPARANTSITGWINIHDQKGIETALLQWREYKESAEEQLKKIEQDFSEYQQRRVNEGYRRPGRMTKELKENKLQTEAKYDVILKEIAELEKKLAAYTDGEQQERDRKVLKGGPKGAGVVKGGQLVEIDGQNVQADDNGVLRIKDSRSRYDGMSTPDYHELIVKPWARANKKLRHEYDQKVKDGEINPRETPKPRAPWPKKPEEESQKEAS